MTRTNYSFVSGQPNWMDDLWGTVGRTAWDGGFFGLLSWSVPMLAGTLVYDLMSSRTERKAILPLMSWGIGLMALGYIASCLTTLYDVRESNTVEVAQPDGGKYAASPVLPPWQNMKGRDWRRLLAEPPFVPPPPEDERKVNYWAMDKRITTQTFIWFSTGFSCAVYALFILICDLGGLQSRLFAMFGANPLAAYIIHHTVEELVLEVVPKDSPAWYAACGLLLFSTITWLFVRHLQKANIYLRL
jgi:apolipoprotein N-acyltransferase